MEMHAAENVEPYAKHPYPPSRAADLLLEIGSVLMMSGAHSGRIRRNIDRVAEAWGYHVELFLTFTGVMVSIREIGDSARRVGRFHRVGLPAVHFGVVTAVSLLTWRVVEDHLTIDDVEKQLAEIRAIPHHPRSWVLGGAGIACACLCLLAGGDLVNAAITLVATVTGLWLRQETLKRRFNPMIAIIVASLVTTLIAGIAVVQHLGIAPEKGLATSVLYLIPGVPLINCVIDLIEGHIPTAIARGVFGGFVLLCIAAGMSAGITLLGIHNF